MSGRKADVIKAAHLCAEAALRLVKPGNQVGTGILGISTGILGILGPSLRENSQPGEFRAGCGSGFVEKWDRGIVFSRFFGGVGAAVGWESCGIYPGIGNSREIRAWGGNFLSLKVVFSMFFFFPEHTSDRGLE